MTIGEDSNSPRSFSEMKVLVVDDTAHMTQMIGELLRGFGFQDIQRSTNGAEAYRILRKSCVDLVLCAYLLDEMNGIEFTRKVRTDPESPDKLVPIIMMTSHADLSTIIEARDAGVSEFIRKPFTATDLRKKVELTFSRPRSFVAADDFFGPDRRRKKANGFEGDERRLTPPKFI